MSSRPWLSRVARLCAFLVLLPGCGDDAAEPAPVDFIGLRVESVTATSAIVRFDTSRPTTCEVEYGADRAVIDQLAEDPSMVDETYSIEHEVPLVDLQPGTTYYYRGRATDAGSRTYRSGLDSFTTLPAGAARPPNVARIAAGAAVVAVSSNFGGGDNQSTWGADNAFDGQMATEWATDGDGDDAFVTISLAEPTPLTGFGFRSRRMPDDSSIVTSVRLTLDGATELGPFDTPDHTTFYIFDFEATSAQRVRFDAEASTGGNTGALEIELYSQP